MLWGFLLAWLLVRGGAWPVSQLWPLPHLCGSLDVRVCSCVPPSPRPSTGWEQSWASSQGTASCFYGRPCCHQVTSPGWAPLCPTGAQSLPVVE